MNYHHELHAALEAVNRAGRAVLEHYERFQQVPDAPSDITTEADRDAQEIILSYLHGLFPADAYCAEETTPTLAFLPHTGPRLWVVDPIDGTRGFARKNGEFSVMIGFVDDGEVAVGVVGEPALHRLTYAVRGGGCWRRDAGDKEPVPCRVSAVAELARATLIQSRSQSGKAPSAEVQAFRPARILETYSAGIKLAKVARGEADLYPNNYPAFHDWDICAGHVLVEEAGGKVTGLRGEPLTYGLPEAPQTLGLLASNGVLHRAAVGR